MGRKPSRKRPYGQHVDLDFSKLTFVDSIQQGPNGADYNVRHINSSDKTYLCPGCLQDILPKTAHIVAWERNHFFGADIAAQERRHWHSNCWKRKLRPQ